MPKSTNDYLTTILAEARRRKRAMTLTPAGAYEHAKRQLAALNLTPAEYERAIKAIAVALNY